MINDKQNAEILDVQISELKGGILQYEVVESLKKQAVNDPTNKKQDFVKIIVQFVFFKPKHHHTRQGSLNKNIAASMFFLDCNLNTGEVFPSANIPPMIPRKLLAPQHESVQTFGHMDDLDVYLDENSIDVNQLRESCKNIDDTQKAIIKLINYSEDLSKSVLHDLFESDDYVQYDQSRAYIMVTQSGAAQNIVRFCDWMIQNPSSVNPLFSKMASDDVSALIVTPSPHNLPHNHLGYASNKYALSDAQRVATIATHNLNDGGVLAVNGPPGTGKTTMLLSIVASEWIRAAINQSEPPIIIAASTNNQAVTNIIDAFAKDFSEGEPPFNGRWIDGVSSYGCRIANDKNKKKERSEGKSYIYANEMDDIVNTENIEENIEKWCRHASIASGKTLSSIDDGVKWLHSKMIELLGMLNDLSSLFDLLRALDQKISDLDSMSAINQLMVNISSEKNQTKSKLKKSTSDYSYFKDKANNHDAHTKDLMLFYTEKTGIFQSILLDLFSFIPSIKIRKKVIISSCIEMVAEKHYMSIDVNSGMFSTMDDAIGILKEKRELYLLMANKYSQESSQHRKNIDQLSDEYEKLDRIISDYTDINKRLSEFGRKIEIITGVKFFWENNINKFNENLDSTLRFRLFRIAVHYWEGKYLQKVNKEFQEPSRNKRKNKKNLMNSWRSRMMLTPCAVSTFHALPEAMKAFAQGDNTSIPDYAINGIDLLIVDEAGQSSPEVSMPSMALAKKALIVGDTFQIEPIWNVNKSIDIGNLRQLGLLENSPDHNKSYEDFLDSSLSSTNGSMMLIAQKATHYHANTDLSRGLYLYEHHRCLNGIIQYCNDLCYKGKLIPKRGNESGKPYPPMGYLHVPGTCESRGGSNINIIEAKVIVEWIKYQESTLIKEYGEIQKAIAVITPFAAQARIIKQALVHTGIKSPIVVGTVHSLQGAECPVIIFSPVYSKHKTGSFTDRGPNMLNVAVSRAKDSFLVFGDMDVFGQSASSPTGKLSRFISRNDLSTNGLPESVIRAMSVEHVENSDILVDFVQHDDFAMNAFQNAKEKIIIISPWVTEPGFKQSGYLKSLVSAMGRGVDICVYFDPRKTFKDNDDIKNKITKRAINESRIRFIPIKSIHSKTIIIDDDIMTQGSFNWLSSVRNEKSDYTYTETSIIIRNKGTVLEFIKKAMPVIKGKQDTIDWLS